MFLILFAFLLNGLAFAAEIKGVAKTLDGKNILYIERHEITPDENGLNKIIHTTYEKPDGVVFAKLSSDFSRHKTIPVVKFQDLRFQKSEELGFVEDGQQIFLKTQSGNKIEEKKFQIDGNMVVGQGFDNFIKRNFQKLSENSISILFGVVSKLDFFGFAAHKRSHSNNRITFGIKVKNIFLRAFLDEIQVEYDAKQRHLVKYVGLSNLPDDKGKDQNVLIEYERIQ